MEKKNIKLGSKAISIKIRTEILEGSVAFDEKLPSERILSEGYGVSRGTIRSALKNLERQGYIVIKPGSGAFISFEKTSWKT